MVGAVGVAAAVPCVTQSVTRLSESPCVASCAVIQMQSMRGLPELFAETVGVEPPEK